jgi:hypothetical protein
MLCPLRPGYKTILLSISDITSSRWDRVSWERDVTRSPPWLLCRAGRVKASRGCERDETGGNGGTVDSGRLHVLVRNHARVDRPPSLGPSHTGRARASAERPRRAAGLVARSTRARRERPLRCLHARLQTCGPSAT